MSRKGLKVPEAIQGRFSAIPHSVMDSPAFQQASSSAIRLLLELARQHTGSNNGRMQLAMGYLKARGWNSVDVVQRARDDLVARRLICQTRQGGLGIGPSLYALTWLPITNFTGLDLHAADYRRGSYAAVPSGMIPKKNTSATPESGSACTGIRSSAAPARGTGTPLREPESGARTLPFEPLAAPESGDNEMLPMGARPFLADVLAAAREFH